MKRQHVLLAALALLLAGCNKEIYQPKVELDFDNSLVNSIEGSATVVAHVTDDGGELTDAGICYVSGSGTPYLSNNKKSAGAKKDIQVNLSGLSRGTYSVRAYATNRAGTSYSTTGEITINGISTPTVVLGDCTYGSSSGTATLVGTVTSNGGATVTEAGFVYLKGTSGMPTLYNYQAISTDKTNLSATLTNLTDGTYRVRAFATNSEGTAYSSTITTFTINRATTTRTIDDVVGTYSATAYNWDDSKYESWTGMTIQIANGNGDNDIEVRYFCGSGVYFATGKWDQANQCIRLRARWYNSNYTFTYDDTTYVAIFAPVYAVNNATKEYYWCLNYANGDKYEILLKYNSAGNLVLTPVTQADKNGRTANGFCFIWYLANDITAAGYRSDIYTSLTIQKTN